VTESEVIRAVISNKSLGGRFKVLKLTTRDSFLRANERRYLGVRYVHLGGHGSPKGIGLIGGSVTWKEVAKKLIAYFPSLKPGEQRVMTLSCCHSLDGIREMRDTLKGHFSAIYHFKSDEIEFAKAMTIWGMFYLKKRLSRPHGQVMKDINTFMGTEVLGGMAI